MLTDTIYYFHIFHYSYKLSYYRILNVIDFNRFVFKFILDIFRIFLFTVTISPIQFYEKSTEKNDGKTGRNIAGNISKIMHACVDVQLVDEISAYQRGT